MSEKQNIIKEFIKTILDTELKDLLKDEMYTEIRNNLIKKSKEYFLSEQVKTILYEFAEAKLLEIEKEDKTFKEVLPKGFENSLKVLAYNKGPEIMGFIKNFINDEKFKEKIKLEINKFIQGVNPMVSKFIKADNISNKIFASLSSYFEDPENMMTIVMEINNKIDEGSNKAVSEITSYIPYEGKMSFVRGFVDILVDSILEDSFINSLVDNIEEKVINQGTLSQLLNTLGITEENIFRRL